MQFFSKKPPADEANKQCKGGPPRMEFASTRALEAELDGSEERFARYFYALYQCSADEEAGVNDLRNRLRTQYPSSVIEVGRRFVLQGEPAFVALISYYKALTEATSLSEEYRTYISRRIEEVERTHRASIDLPIPVELTEGQLAHDPQLQLLTCVALLRRQIVCV